MHTFRRFIRFVFGFSRKETNGFIILIPLMVFIIFFPSVYHRLAGPEKGDFSAETRALDSLAAVLEKHPTRQPEEPLYAPPAVERLQAFDPNVATAGELQALGFAKGVAARIIKYREKGGRFDSREDLLKIYGMDSALFTRLRPHIQLPPRTLPSGLTTGSKPVAKKKVAKKKEVFDLNLTDTAQLVSVYGIGPVLSSRIVRYRERLGGFVRNDQLYEVYGLDSGAVNRLLEVAFIQPSFEPEKISLNGSSEEELSGHPYISKATAKVIVAYRFQHGYFTGVKDIRGIHVIDERTFLKIEPYLTVE